MNETPEEIISIREFARRCGVSDTAIHKAIKSGRIVGGYDAERKKILYSIAASEYAGNTNPNSNGRSSTGGAPRADGKKPIPRDRAGEGRHPIEGAKIAEDGATMTAAKKMKAVYDAKIREAEYKQKIGDLVEKAQVYRELFNAGREIRTAIMAIPDRIIDAIMAADSRAEAHSALRRALSDALEGLSDIEKREYGKQQ